MEAKVLAGEEFPFEALLAYIGSLCLFILICGDILILFFRVWRQHQKSISELEANIKEISKNLVKLLLVFITLLIVSFSYNLSFSQLRIEDIIIYHAFAFLLIITLFYILNQVKNHLLKREEVRLRKKIIENFPSNCTEIKLLKKRYINAIRVLRTESKPARLEFPIIFDNIQYIIVETGFFSYIKFRFSYRKTRISLATDIERVKKINTEFEEKFSDKFYKFAKYKLPSEKNFELPFKIETIITDFETQSENNIDIWFSQDKKIPLENYDISINIKTSSRTGE